MGFTYDVQVLELREVHEIPGAWDNQALKDLLNETEYDDVDSIEEADLKEMAAMALSDLEPQEAAEMLLKLRFGDKLNKGQRQNLARDFNEDRLWEEYSEIHFHEEIFNVACMLYWAFPKQYSEPDIVRIQLKVAAQNGPSSANLQNPTAACIARLLNDGMNDHNTIYRLFDDQLAANAFPEAEDIIWKFENAGFDSASNSAILTIHTSWNWVDELKGVKEYESTAYADGQLK